MKLMSADELEARLRDIGARRYHRLHPFHALLHGGKCSKGQVPEWALNRYYYQASIPLKDASLIARCDDPDLRRDVRTARLLHPVRLAPGDVSVRGFAPGGHVAQDAEKRIRVAQGNGLLLGERRQDVGVDERRL